MKDGAQLAGDISEAEAGKKSSEGPLSSLSPHFCLLPQLSVVRGLSILINQTSIYSLPGARTVLDTEDSSVSKTKQNFCPHGVYVLLGEDRQQTSEVKHIGC